MNYQIDIYQTNANNTCRYALGISGRQPLIAVGLNPSTADDHKPDQSISKLMGFAVRNGYDGFVMLNLYPQRTPYPERIHKRWQKELHRQNLNQVKAVLHRFQPRHMLAAWGSIIEVRPWMKDALKDISQQAEVTGTTWIQIGHGTAARHPRHPSRAPYSLTLSEFDLVRYVGGLSS